LKIAVGYSLAKKVKIIESNEDFLHLASFLDPRFKKLQYLDCAKKESVLVTLKNYIRKYAIKFKEKNIVQEPIKQQAKRKIIHP